MGDDVCGFPCAMLNFDDSPSPPPPPVFGDVSEMILFPERAPSAVLEEYYLYHLESCIRETEELQDIYLPADISKCIVDYLQFCHGFFVGQQLDVQDSVKKWCKAEVRDIKQVEPNPLLFIHYQGWHEKWDEWIDATSSRIAPFETHTLGIDTGNKLSTTSLHRAQPQTDEGDDLGFI
eukprot:TRINITY_DN14173_c0_g1_i2.p1 TRINITY_DN14173_c0_g1~~TRINITY_DN14173_c0_g1_i2.p1  ORF type:complete len:187 (+),score=40.40 TRINITY_DN14173_c0_g1_i2:30-563(+)